MWRIFSGVRAVHRRVTGFCARRQRFLRKKQAGGGFREDEFGSRYEGELRRLNLACEYLVKAGRDKGFGGLRVRGIEWLASFARLDSRGGYSYMSLGLPYISVFG
jgi:hypothetical protein